MRRWSRWADQLGKTKKITEHGIEDVSNDMGAFMVVSAASQEQAAKLFEHHPRRCRSSRANRVEVMPVLPIPEG